MTSPTITTNSNLAFVRADFETLTEGLDYAARGSTGCNFFSSRGAFEQAVGYAQIREKAIDLAQAFDRAGFERGSRMAIVAETTPDFMYFFFACQYAGMLPVALPLSIHLSGHEEYVRNLANLIGKAGANYAVGSPELIEYVREAAPQLEMIGTPANYFALPTTGGNLRPFQKNELSYIQFSSGSTSSPRGVVISQRAITSNTRGILRNGLAATEADRAASWLPLYHDMGLVGFCLAPMMGQISIDYMATQSFARRPMVWLQIISEHGATVSFSPNFGYDLCARRGLSEKARSLDLSNWRVAGIGGEMIYPNTLNEFAKIFGQVGFSKNAFMPCYGQAETTLGTTFGPVDSGFTVEYVDREQLANSRKIVRAKVNGHTPGDDYRPFIKCGGPIPGHKIDIRDDLGSPLPEDQVGRIVVSGPSLMDGYFRDPEGTASVMEADGWMDTGDLGYMSDGQLVITGRQKDLIILNGRNIWPQDIEMAVEKIDRIRSSDVACFSVSLAGGGERMVLVVHCRVSASIERDELRKTIMAKVKKASGADCEILLVSPGTLPFTSSGKLSRAAVKSLYLNDELVDLAQPQTSFNSQPNEEPLAAMAG